MASVPVVSPEHPEDKVETPSVAYQEMAERWCLLEDLLGGTRTMRKAGIRWLPQEPKESDPQYHARVKRTFLFPGYEDAVDSLSGKPFSKPITVNGALNEQLAVFESDVDRTGRDLTQFSRDLLSAALVYGVTHIFVDFPKIPQNAGGKPVSLAEERAINARPVFVHVKAPALLGWRTETLPNGEERITMVRFKEIRREPFGLFGDKEVEYIRVITPTTWELWKNEKESEAAADKYVQAETGTHTFGEVPWVTLYLTRTGSMTADPPLEGLAWINLAHWQSSSDQRNILRFARIGILFGRGFTEEEVEKGITIGPSKVILSSTKDADLKYVEHTGAAIQAGERDLEKLETQMEALGMEPMVERPGNQTATATAIDESKSKCDLQAWVRSEENAIGNAFRLAAKWLKTDLPEDFGVDINDDFGISLRGATDYDMLLKMRAQGELTRITFLREVKRRGLLADTVDPEQESEDAKLEGPELSAMGGGVSSGGTLPGASGG